VLYLAGVNKHAGFRAVGSNQWKVTAVMVFYEQVVVFSTRKITLKKLLDTGNLSCLRRTHDSRRSPTPSLSYVILILRTLICVVS
jgi:hypothetical protein